MPDLPSEFLSRDTVAAAAADAALRDAAALEWRAVEAAEADDSGLRARGILALPPPPAVL